MVEAEEERLRLEQEAVERDVAQREEERESMKQEDLYAWELRLRRKEIRRMEHEDVMSFIFAQYQLNEEERLKERIEAVKDLYAPFEAFHFNQRRVKLPVLHSLLQEDYEIDPFYDRLLSPGSTNEELSPKEAQSSISTPTVPTALTATHRNALPSCVNAVTESKKKKLSQRYIELFEDPAHKTAYFEQFMDKVKSNTLQAQLKQKAMEKEGSIMESSFSQLSLSQSPPSIESLQNIPVDTYIMTATNSYRKPFPAEEMLLSQSDKLAVQQHHHHHFKAKAAGAPSSSESESILVEEKMMAPLLSSSHSISSSSSVNSTSLKFIDSGVVELFDDAVSSVHEASNTSMSMSLSSSSARAKPRPVVVSKPPPPQRRGVLPQVFNSHQVDREKNKVLIPSSSVEDEDRDRVNEEVEDPFREAFLEMVVNNRDKIVGAQVFRNSISALNSRNTISSHADEISINTELQDQLLAKISIPPLLIYAESMAQSGDEQWIHFLRDQEKLSFASFSAIDYIDAKGNPKKHRVKKDLVSNKGFDGKKLTEMANLKKELEKLGIVDESIIDFKTKRMAQSASESVLQMRLERKKLKRFVGSHSVIEDKYYLKACEPGIREATSLQMKEEATAFLKEITAKDAFVREFHVPTPHHGNHHNHHHHHHQQGGHVTPLQKQASSATNLLSSTLPPKGGSDHGGGTASTYNSTHGRVGNKKLVPIASRPPSPKFSDLIRPIVMSKPSELSPLSVGLSFSSMKLPSPQHVNLHTSSPANKLRGGGSLQRPVLTPLEEPSLKSSDESTFNTLPPDLQKLKL